MEHSAQSTKQAGRSETRGASARRAEAEPWPLHPILQLQRDIGNQAVLSLLRSGAIQAKLAVGAVDDPLEHEADRVADQVMRMPHPALAISTAPPQMSRKCAACEEEDAKTLRTKSAGASRAAGGEAPSIVHDALRSPGQPLDVATRAYFEPRFRRDFGGVSIHTGEKAAESARAMNALAYTVGSDVVFAAGRYVPTSDAGRQLIAHELTHVLQQSNGVPREQASGGASHSADDVGSRRRSPALPPPSAATTAIRRKEAGSSRPAAPVPRGAPIIEDRQIAAAGQMRRSEFLSRLGDALIQECDVEFAEVGRTARECPYILRTIDFYASRPVADIVNVVRRFAHPPAGTDADGLIRAVAQRARIAARNIAKKTDGKAQAKSENGPARLPAHDPVAIRAQLDGGRPLDAPVRGYMERSFDRSFASVRIHDDVTAARFSEGLGARAFTIGADIAFGAGEYRPGTSTGDALIAHELAHTIQQGSRTPGASGDAEDRRLEQQAEHASSAAMRGRGAAASLEEAARGIRVQRLPVVAAGAIVLAEATPEIVVAAEIGTDVVVVDGVVVAADVSVPAVVDVVAPAAVDVVAPAAVDTATAATTSSAVSTTTAAVSVGAAATLSGDSPQQSDPQRTCQENTNWPICGDLRTLEEVAESLAIAKGAAVSGMDCEGYSSIGSADVCGGQPGEVYHCDINDSDLTISLIGCFCCNVDGSQGFEWHPHQSPGEPDTGRGRRQEDTRRDRRENKGRDRQRRDRRDQGDD
jgi:hypothetical protein